MKKIFGILLLYFSSFNVYPCNYDTIHFRGYYVFEFSNELRAVDDMIFRKSAIIALNRKPIYKKGIFLFESGNSVPLDKIQDCGFSNEMLNKIKQASRFTSDSLHNVISNLKTSEIKYKGMVYKKIYIDFIAINLGKRKVYVYNKNKISYKRIPTYLIIDFLEIKSS